MAIEVIDTLKPKNGQEFSVAEAVDIAFNGEMTVKGKIDALQTQVDTLATDSEVATALALKADASDVNTALDTKASTTALTVHTNNNDIHVTAADKTAWNLIPRSKSIDQILGINVYKDFVVPLTEVTTGVENTYFYGQIFLKRTNNGSDGITIINAMCGKRYNQEKAVYNIDASDVFTPIKPCVFSYNSKKYFGLHVNIATSEYEIFRVDARTTTNYNDIKMIFIYDTNAKQVINSEIYNSLDFATLGTSVNTNFYAIPQFVDSNYIKRKLLYFSPVPATLTSSGTVGDIAYDTNYMYICTATNIWKKLPLGTAHEDNTDIHVTSADKTAWNGALISKADTSTVNTALALKANASDVNTALISKADTSTVNTALALKANASDVNTALALKADAATYANGISYLGTKATLAEIQAITPTIASGEPKHQYFCSADSHYYTWDGTAWADTGTMNSAASEVEAARGTQATLKSRLDATDSELSFVRNDTYYEANSAIVSTWYNKSTDNATIPANVEPTSATNRLLNTDTLANAHVISAGEVVTCSVQTGYKYAVYIFNPDTKAMITVDNSQAWQTVERQFTVTEDAKIIVMVGKSDNTDINVSENTNATVTKSLTLKSKTVSMAGDVDNIKAEVGAKDTVFVVTWYNKSTNSTDIICGAAPSDSTTRLLSTSTISNAQNLKAGEAIKCSVDSGYKYAVYAFNATSRAMINIENSQSWKTSELTFETPEDSKIIIMVGKNDDSTISPSDASNVVVKRISLKGKVDNLSEKLKALPTPSVCDGSLTLPAGFALPFDLFKIDGKYVADVTPESLNVGATNVYIKTDGTTGLGATEETAISLSQFKQNIINSLYSSENIELIFVNKINLINAKNTFDLIGTSNTNVKNITITSKDGTAWIGMGATKTWAYANGVYSAAEATKVSDIVDLANVNHFGMPKLYEKKNTVELVTANKGTFCQAGGVVYVNPHLGNSINDIACLYGFEYKQATDCGVISIRKNNSGNVVFKNIGFLMDSLMLQDTKTVDCNYWFFGCKWHRGSQDAFGINGAYKAYLIDCVSDYASKDNFNYHSTTKDSVAVEVNCVAYGAGKYKLDTTGANTDQSSCNGSTAHNGITVMRFGCKYWECEGPIVADVHNCKTLNVECSAKNVLSSISNPQYNAPYMIHDNRNALPGLNQSYRTDVHSNYLIGCTGAGATYKYDVEGMKVVVNDLVTNIDSQYVTSDSTVTYKSNVLY